MIALSAVALAGNHRGKRKFDENGRRDNAGLLIVQWRKGIPNTVYPPRDELAATMCPKPGPPPEKENTR